MAIVIACIALVRASDIAAHPAHAAAHRRCTRCPTHRRIARASPAAWAVQQYQAWNAYESSRRNKRSNAADVSRRC